MPKVNLPHLTPSVYLFADSVLHVRGEALLLGPVDASIKANLESFDDDQWPTELLDTWIHYYEHQCKELAHLPPAHRTVARVGKQRRPPSKVTCASDCKDGRQQPGPLPTCALQVNWSILLRGVHTGEFWRRVCGGVGVDPTGCCE